MLWCIFPCSSVKVTYHGRREQGPSGCPKSTGFSPIQPWFHVMQYKSVLDPAAFWYSREPPMIWAELLLAYTHVSRNGTADDRFTFVCLFVCFKADRTELETETALMIVNTRLFQTSDIVYPTSPKFWSVTRPPV